MLFTKAVSHDAVAVINNVLICYSCENVLPSPTFVTVMNCWQNRKWFRFSDV